MSKNPRKVPYGWKLDGDKLVKDAAAQKVIKEIVELSRQGCSLAMIAVALNGRGIRTHRGGKWHGSTVSNVVKDNAERIPAAPKASPKPRLSFPETMEEAIERRLREDPNASYFQWEDMVWDEDTGQQKSVLKSLHIKTSKEWLTDSAKRRMIEAEALKSMTVAERAETFRFHEPLRIGFGTSWSEGPNHGINEIISEMARATGRDMHKLIDGVTGQQAFKALLRKHANLLCQEIGIQRQVNVTLRQKLLKAEKDLADLRNPKPPQPTTPAKAPVARLPLVSRKQPPDTQ